MCPKAQKAEKELNRQKNVPSHKGPSFLCFVSVSQSVTSFEEWNCHLFLVGLVAETGGGWLELKLLPLRAQCPTARSHSEAEWDLCPYSSPSFTRSLFPPGVSEIQSRLIVSQTGTRDPQRGGEAPISFPTPHRPAWGASLPPGREPRFLSQTCDSDLGSPSTQAPTGITSPCWTEAQALQVRFGTMMRISVQLYVSGEPGKTNIGPSSAAFSLGASSEPT